MTSVGAQVAQDHCGWTPVSQPVGGFVNYLRMMSEAFSEGMQQASEARRKHLFADV